MRRRHAQYQHGECLVQQAQRERNLQEQRGDSDAGLRGDEPRYGSRPTHDAWSFPPFHDGKACHSVTPRSR